ncbi:hypothetical protein chiPu_0024322 [Chiloscyllium punctatum]|uniref:Uncharacterized protein n=1 Tax=Chiloscyllium punctatum TaxID=137246 RepID=A0A401TCB6_CHIPU|nr:hypothetical protein [Chiloscyllium punctatum]
MRSNWTPRLRSTYCPPTNGVDLSRPWAGFPLCRVLIGHSARTDVPLNQSAPRRLGWIDVQLSPINALSGTAAVQWELEGGAGVRCLRRRLVGLR